MLDKKYIKQNIHLVKERLALKGYELDVDKFTHLESKRVEIQTELEKAQALKNKIANEMKILFKSNVKEDQALALKKRDEGAEVNSHIQGLKEQFEKNQENFVEMLLEMPNMPAEDCVIGNDEDDNKEIEKVMVPKVFDFNVRDHVEIGQMLDNQIDFEKGVKLAKSRFTVLKGQMAKLHRALGQFMLDVHTKEHGYLEMDVPIIVNKETLTNTGQLPKFKDDLFKIEGLEMALIPTAEVPLTNMVANETMQEEELPLKLTAKTLCFRSEVGSAGRDVKGILRQHQFEKVELVQIVKPENSDEALIEILNHAKKILDLLELPYRVVELCTGDLGFGARKTYDIEVWVPSQNKYREISSCSNMGDFQARRLNAKLKQKDGKKVLLHTLNGSGLAVGRTLLALIENNQQEDGTITIPDVLKKYL